MHQDRLDYHGSTWRAAVRTRGSPQRPPRHGATWKARPVSSGPRPGSILFFRRAGTIFSRTPGQDELRTRSFLQPYLSVRFVAIRDRLSAWARPLLNTFQKAQSSQAWSPHRGLAQPYGLVRSGHSRQLPDGPYAARLPGGASGQWQKLPEAEGWFVDTSLDALFVSRFDNDFLVYSQSRLGYMPSHSIQFYWNANLTSDVKRQYWADFVETGRGAAHLRQAAAFPVGVIQLPAGAYLTNVDNPAARTSRTSAWTLVCLYDSLNAASGSADCCSARLA